jgi:PiT family inorganic phosphate transporter
MPAAIADLINLTDLTLTSGSLLLLALGLALSFEFINGFHDTANAVATVIYTRSLQPEVAVIWSGIWNLIGVLTSTGVVAFSIVTLLPMELVLHLESGAGFVMVLTLLVSAIVWNLGTWYLGLPTSSSHTLIGSILGVGVANALLHREASIDLSQAQDVLIALLVSPVIGFSAAALLMGLVQFLPQLDPDQAPEAEQLLELEQASKAEQPPPLWIRTLLILTCTGVSFAHGSNDGQKGMGLMMLILAGLLPGLYAVNLSLTPAALSSVVATSQAISAMLPPVEIAATVAPSVEAVEAELLQFLRTAEPTPATLPALAMKQQQVATLLSQLSQLAHASQPVQLSSTERLQLRTDLYLLSAALEQLQLHHLPELSSVPMQAYRRELERLTQFIPLWVKLAVALALSSGTMIGWKRIVVTIGEKVGKAELTYAQGATAELVAFGTILAADQIGVPVSTTHVLASGIAGSMTVSGAGVQTATIRNILLSWILTLPVCMLLGSSMFAIGLAVLRLLQF